MMSYYFLQAIGDGSEIVQDAQSVQLVISNGMNQLWNDIYAPSGIYGALATIGGLFASITLAFSLVQIIKELIGEERSFIPYERFIWWAMVILLLFNDGAFLREMTFSFRDLVRSTNQLVLSQTVDGLTLEEQLQRANASVGTSVALDSAVAQCAMLTDTVQRTECFGAIDSETGSIFDNLPSIPSVDDILTGISNGLERSFIAIMLGLSIAFQWLIEVTLILTGLLGPIAVGLSLLPVTQKALYTWLIAFYSVGLCQLCYNILIGMLATLQTTADESATRLVFTIGIGLLAPILSVLLASGGGVATFSSLGGIAGAVAGKVGGGASKGVKTLGSAGWRKFRSIRKKGA